MGQWADINTDAMKSVLGSFYGVYSKRVSVPYLAAELSFSDTSCDRHCLYAESCCALKACLFEKCASLMEISQKDIERFMLEEGCQCSRSRLPWKKKLRLSPYEHGIPALKPRPKIELGRLLVICLLTPSCRYNAEQGCVAWNILRESFESILVGETEGENREIVHKILSCLYQEEFVPDSEHKTITMLSEALKLYEEDQKRQNVYEDWKALLPPNKVNKNEFTVKRERRSE